MTATRALLIHMLWFSAKDETFKSIIVSFEKNKYNW